MKTVAAVPYRRALPHRIATSDWDVLSGEAFSPLPQTLTGLDYNSVVRLRREVIVDTTGLRADCGLGTDVPLLLAASWSSSGTMLRRSLGKVSLSQDDACLVEIAGDISGGDIAGTLYIDTSILVASDRKGGEPLTARHAGTVLLQERQIVQLDTSTSFFPVEVVDFNVGLWANPDAGWRLSWNALALDQPFLGSVRLLINAGHPRVVHAVSAATPTAESTVIRSAIYFDVARALIFGALGSDEFIERDGDYAEGSCGKTIYAMIQMLYPGDGILGLASAANQRRDHFDSDLQGRLRIFWS